MYKPATNQRQDINSDGKIKSVVSIDGSRGRAAVLETAALLDADRGTLDFG